MKFLVPGLAVLLTLLAVEIGFRVNHYRHLGEDQINFLHLPSTFFEYDEKLGFHYTPNVAAPFSWFVETGKIVRRNFVRTNNHGHVSHRPYDYKRKAGEYRIAIVGDSLAACIHNDFPWADTLEDLLNQDSKLKSKLGAKTFKVFNLALDGIGVGQMPAVVEHEVSKYSPDLILVNFITADIYRRFVWRKSIQPDPATPQFNTPINCVSLPADLSNPDCSYGSIVSTPSALIESPEELKKLRHTIGRLVSARVPWFTPYPQFLSWAMGGKFEEWVGRNPYNPMTSNIESRDESKAVTVAAIRKMRQLAKNTDFLLTPTYWEIIYGAIPKLAGEVMDLVPEIPITPMIAYLPDVRDKAIIDTWTNHPYDMHWSNLGARLYAQAMQKYLRVKFKTESLYSSNLFEESSDSSRHFSN